MGANIKGAGTDVIRIKGVEKLHRTEYSIIPDQIEAGTFMFAAAATGGDITVKNVIPKASGSQPLQSWKRLAVKWRNLTMQFASVQEGDCTELM